MSRRSVGLVAIAGITMGGVATGLGFSIGGLELGSIALGGMAMRRHAFDDLAFGLHIWSPGGADGREIQAARASIARHLSVERFGTPRSLPLLRLFLVQQPTTPAIDRIATDTAPEDDEPEARTY